MKKKHLDFLEKKLIIKKIDIISKLPRGVSYFTWSLGVQLETLYYYKIITVDNRIVYCQITTLFGIFILQSLFFEEKGDKYIRVYI